MYRRVTIDRGRRKPHFALVQSLVEQEDWNGLASRVSAVFASPALREEVKRGESSLAGRKTGRCRVRVCQRGNTLLLFSEVTRRLHSDVGNLMADMSLSLSPLI